MPVPPQAPALVDPHIAKTHAALFDTWFPLEDLPIPAAIKPDIAGIAAGVSAAMLAAFSQSPGASTLLAGLTDPTVLLVDAYQFNALMTKLTEYIDHGTDTLQKIDGDIAARLGQITEPQRASQTLANPASGTVSVNYYWWWRDNGDGSPEQDYPDTSTGGCNSTMVQHQDQAQADRDAHYVQVQSQLNSQYYAGDPDKAHATVAKWKDMQTEFAQYAPKSS